MPLLNDWIDDKLTEIANKLPTIVHKDPASFACGFNAGYKQAVLDLERFMDGIEELKEFSDVYIQEKWRFN